MRLRQQPAAFGGFYQGLNSLAYMVFCGPYQPAVMEGHFGCGAGRGECTF